MGLNLKEKFFKNKEKKEEEKVMEEAKKKASVTYIHHQGGCEGVIDAADGSERGLKYYQCQKCGNWIDKYTVIFGKA